jgi:hypothetical protein
MREAASKNGWDIVASSVSLGDAFTVPSCFVLVKRDGSIDGREYSTHEFANGHFFWGHYDLTADQRAATTIKEAAIGCVIMRNNPAHGRGRAINCDKYLQEIEISSRRKSITRSRPYALLLVC